ncbi:MAG TPA: hypothetical protein VG370_08345 [Chloroflexota bacterium]|jgi:hypothetical protein|nr:hypothetical protein [Chloroflexota bacterium]
MTAPDWHYRAVSWVLPPAAAASVRARTEAAGAGDGSSVHGARILVRRAVGDGAPPIGRIFLRWDAPEGDVTVHRIGWDAANGGSELAVRRAVERLSGEPVGGP